MRQFNHSANVVRFDKQTKAIDKPASTITVERALLVRLLESCNYEIADRSLQTRVAATDSEALLTRRFEDRARLHELLGIEQARTSIVVGDDGQFVVNGRGIPKGAVPEAYRHIICVNLAEWRARHPGLADRLPEVINLNDITYTYRDGTTLRNQQPKVGAHTAEVDARQVRA